MSKENSINEDELSACKLEEARLRIEKLKEEIGALRKPWWK